MRRLAQMIEGVGERGEGTCELGINATTDRVCLRASRDFMARVDQAMLEILQIKRVRWSPLGPITYASVSKS